MVENRWENRISLRGQVVAEPKLSHRNHGVDYYTAPLRVPRLSGADDVVNIIMAGQELEPWCQGRWLSVQGEVRSYNNRSGQGSRLVITVLARSAVETADETGENRLVLSGALCKPAVCRRTPLGREICDLLLAVNRPYGRADYLPCIAWGSLAGYCGELAVGDQLRLEGRLQSRQYFKVLDGEKLERTAYEVSIMNLLEEQEDSDIAQ